MERNIKALIAEEPWIVPYLGREIRWDKDDVDGIFEWTFCPYGDEYYYETGICLDVYFGIHEDKTFSHVDIKKYKDYSPPIGHGKPSTDEVPITAKDRKRILEILDEYTIPRGETLLQKTLKQAETDGIPGWEIISDKKTNIVFKNTDTDEIVTIGKKKIINALEWSYTYLEILDDPDFWTANQKTLSVESPAPLLALFSLINQKEYPYYNHLIQAKETRNYESYKDEYKKMLSLAIENNDFDTVEKYSFCVKDLAQSIAIASKNGNLEMVKLLLQYGAKLSYLDFETDSANALVLAIKNDDEALFDLLITGCTSYLRPKGVIAAAIETGKLYYLDKSSELEFPSIETWKLSDPTILTHLRNNIKISWTPEQIKILYDLGYYEETKRIISGIYLKEYPNKHEKSTSLVTSVLDKKASVITEMLERVYEPWNTGVVSEICKTRHFELYTEDDNNELLSFLARWCSFTNIINYQATLTSIFVYGNQKTINIYFDKYAHIYEDLRLFKYLIEIINKNKLNDKLSSVLKPIFAYYNNYLKNYKIEDVKYDINDIKFMFDIDAVDICKILNSFNELEEESVLGFLCSLHAIENNERLWYEYASAAKKILEIVPFSREYTTETKRITEISKKFIDNSNLYRPERLYNFMDDYSKTNS